MPANITALGALDRLRAGSARFASNVTSIAERMVTTEGVMAIGAGCDLEPGRVQFFG
jgi:hypothetical protein